MAGDRPGGDAPDGGGESLVNNDRTAEYTHLIRRVDRNSNAPTTADLIETGRAIAESVREATPESTTTATVGDKYCWNPARETGKATAKIGAGAIFGGLWLGVYSIANSVEYGISEPIESVTGTLATAGLIPIMWGGTGLARAAWSQASTETRGQTEAAAGMLLRTTSAGTEALQVVPDTDPTATDSGVGTTARQPSQKPQIAAMNRLPAQQTGQWKTAGADLTHLLSPDKTPLSAGTTVKLAVITIAQQTPAGRIEKGRGANTEATTGKTKADELLGQAASYDGEEPLVVLSKIAPYARGVPDTRGLAAKREDGLVSHPLSLRRPASYLSKYLGREETSLFGADKGAAERLRAINERSLSAVRIIAASTNTSREMDTVAQNLKTIVNNWTGSANVTAQANIQTITVGDKDAPLKKALDLTTYYRAPALRSLRKPTGSTGGLNLTLPRNKDTKLRHGDQYRSLTMDNTEVGSLFVISGDTEGATDLVEVSDPDGSRGAGGPTVDRTRLDNRR